MIPLFILLACGRQNAGSSDYQKAVVGQGFALSDEYSDKERSIIDRLCTSYRNKRIQFQSLQETKKLDVKFEDKQCDNVQKTKIYNAELTLKQLLASGPMYFDGSVPVSYFSIVQTDKHGEAKDICEAVLSDKLPKKVITEREQITMYQFLRSNEYDGVDVIRKIIGAQDSATGELIGEKIIDVKVKTDSQSGHTIGLVMEIYKQEQCQEFPEKMLSFKQLTMKEK
ncbi:hypothetical protein HBN50_07300 [Halobacteriovorax sp. GB3]|uniref:hypothetical protein n=1 Tax=Halobacteriovorax sp. GB3 TaxID=2719615 RepID=UPI00236221E1|nr:hypothetical protein [Halobacteriovorax sp. GB3]MDD0852895.1 hypothetical protein [Halobacteriovorax sp. GB3]